MRRMKKTKTDDSGSDSDESDSSDVLPKKGQASNAQSKEEEEVNQEEPENESENENSSMKSKGTSGKKVSAKQESAKRGREDKTEREPESKKMKTPMHENGGSKMEEEPQKKSRRASKKAGKAEMAEKAEDADSKEEHDKGDNGVEKSNQKKSRKQKKQLQEESQNPETSKEKENKVKSTPEKVKQELAEAAPPKSGRGNNWSPKDEYALAKQMLQDLKAGSDFHNKPKNDSYWADMCESLKGKLEGDFSKDQIHDKHKRMKSKYEKFKNDKSGKKRNATDEELQTVFKQLFDREAAKEQDVATAKEAESNVALTVAAGIQSDGEEINEHMDTSEPGVPALEPKKQVRKNHSIFPEPQLKNENTETSQEAMHQLGQMMKDFQTAMVETMFKASMATRQPSADPILASMTVGLPSLISSYKLGFEAANGNSEDMRRRFLEDKLLEYSTLKRKMELLLDYYKLEEELVKKELEALQ